MEHNVYIKPTRLEPVKVEWTDACSVQEDTRQWLEIEEAVEKARNDFNDYNVSYGVIIHKENDFLVIAGTSAGDVYSDITMIPMKNVVKISKLK